MNSENQTMMERTKICSAEMGDRISLLPDELLHLILSYLNTKLAVQTCILSKRWRYLWIGISTLYLEGSSFSDDSSFMKFLNHVLLHRDHSKTICCFLIDISFPHHLDLLKLSVDYRDYFAEGIEYKYFINMFGTIGSAKVVSISYAAIGALFNVPDVVKGKQSPLRGIEELKIIVQNRNTEVEQDTVKLMSNMVGPWKQKDNSLGKESIILKSGLTSCKYNAEMGDRISRLPDKLLHLILSCLNTKLAVQTCVLSERWRYLWTGISTLHFDESSFPEYYSSSDDSSSPEDSSSSDDSSFMKFLNHVLLHRDHSKTIRKFKITYSFDKDSIEKLVLDFLVTHGHGIQDFYLSATAGDSVISRPFLDHFLNWDSLKTLTLYCIVIPPEDDLNFVSITTLHLINCRIFNVYRSKNSSEIIAPQLKEFKMLDFYFEDHGFDLKLILSFPKLLSFCFDGDRTSLIPISFPHNLVLLKLSVHYRDVFKRNVDYKNFINMFGAVSSAKVVTVSYRTMLVLSKIPDVDKRKHSPLCGIEELKIIVPRRSSTMAENFSFNLPASGLSYLLSRCCGCISKVLLFRINGFDNYKLKEMEGRFEAAILYFNGSSAQFDILVS
ncbi:F-box/LRR-repeat protein 25-like [Senna tora]|uniref:F-box/LRR-repeat protein 25-like n=1 Tax=Senna tora TaxID=362788 RepID=A0A835CHS1_9FABA|nr:F-box/LRR-repeat protein 25-like [Senna tora]